MLENLTAGQLLNFEFGAFGDTKVLLLNLLAFMLGLAIHTFKEMKKEEIGFMEYWTQHGVNSLSSLGALLATFFSMMSLSPEAPMYAYFSMAFLGDALLNKAPVNAVRKRGMLLDIKNNIIAEHKEHPVKVIGCAVLFVVVLLVLI